MIFPTLRERRALALVAARSMGHGGHLPQVVRLGEVIPVTKGEPFRGAPDRRHPTPWPSGLPVEVLLDQGSVVLTRLRAEWAGGPMMWLDGVTGGYAAHRVRMAHHGSRWSSAAGGWWRAVGRPQVDTWTDWAHPDPDDDDRMHVGQCLMDARGEWVQAPRPGAVLLEWTQGAPFDFYARAGLSQSWEVQS